MTSIILSVFLIAVAGTFYEFSQLDKCGNAQKKNHNFIQKVMLAFSFRKNTMELLNTHTQKDEILCLHGIRFVFSVIIYVLHRAIFNMFWPATNRTNTAQLLESVWTMTFRSVWNNVDTFLVLSGLLTSYYTTRDLQAGRSLNIPAMYLRRYIKFTPILMLAVFIIRNTIEELRRGPQVIQVVKRHVQACQNIWKPLFYVSNFDGIDQMCFPPAHHLMSDFYLYLGSPFLILLLWKYRLRGALYLVIALGCITAYKAVLINSGHLASFIYYGIQPTKMSESASRLYLNPLFRSMPYVVGILLGFYLRITPARSAMLTRGDSKLNGNLSGAYSIAKNK
ncbi:hypothetical protein J6590_084646 [Homalodisca vitripennis]|nr:hypothetical protein J6590_084646 [Homalodisca vitripennis]